MHILGQEFLAGRMLRRSGAKSHVSLQPAEKGYY